jgi:hypothetical protein
LLRGGKIAQCVRCPAGLAGRIVACGYHRHEAVVHVIGDSEPAAPAIVVRMITHCHSARTLRCYR